jgi:23S rRNA (uracil1939-C5)-methyltransferase
VKGKRSEARKGPRDVVLDGRVRDVTDAGDAVIETEQGIVMARGALPGERVRVRVSEARGGVLRGALLGISSASPDRIEPQCGLSERCGGCPLMALALGAQRALKLDRVRRALVGVCAAGVVMQLEDLGAPFGYRRRARFAWKQVGRSVVLGYHAHGSRQLIDVAACPVLEPALAQALSAVRSALIPRLTGSGEIELSALDSDHVFASVHSDAALTAESYRAAETLACTPPVVSVALRVNDGAPARFGNVVGSAVGLDGAPLLAPVEGFSQVNAAVNARLGELVLELAAAHGVHVLELYAGQGNFSIGLAAQAESLIAVESNQASASACRDNLRVRQYARARVIASDVATARLPDRCDVIVLDPPRGGAPELAALAARSHAQRVVYVSCHMTTLGRDLRALHAVGFEADRIHALDMFPQTAHVEAVVRMRRSAS